MNKEANKGSSRENSQSDGTVILTNFQKMLMLIKII